jgi:hypothetical protein
MVRAIIGHRSRQRTGARTTPFGAAYDHRLHFGDGKEEIATALRQAELIIYTLGVAPCFFEAATGKFAMPERSEALLGAVRGRYIFRNTSVDENYQNLRKIILVVREENPNCKFVFHFRRSTCSNAGKSFSDGGGLSFQGDIACGRRTTVAERRWLHLLAVLRDRQVAWDIHTRHVRRRGRVDASRIGACRTYDHPKFSADLWRGNIISGGGCIRGCHSLKVCRIASQIIAQI